MSAGNLSIFVPINKIDEEQRLVYGQVAAEVIDNSGEVFDYEASKPYFQKWSENAHITSGGKSKGNLRVMHTSKVAGVVTDLGFDDENRVIEACAKVVDDNEWNMVKAGAYTGFSMGGRYVNRVEKTDSNGKVVKTYTADPVEISLVDKPCIPTAVFSVVKADGIVEQRHFAESVQSEDGVDLEKASGPARHPKGSSKGGQFAPGKGGAGATASNWRDAAPTRFVNGKGTSKEQIDREVKRVSRNAVKDGVDRPERLRSVAKDHRRISASHAETAENWAKQGKYETAARVMGSSKFQSELADALEAKASQFEAKATKSDDGDHMYIPTNDEILPVARALAKAAGKTEDDWLEFSDQAREDLIAKASMEKPEDEDDDELDNSAPGESEDDEPDNSASEGDEEEEESEEDDAKAEKSDEPEVEQGWRAKDGTFFVKKADALAHNQTLAKADEEPSLVDQLRATVETVERIAKGEVVTEEGEDEVVEKSDVEKMADALDELVKIDHGGTLQKSMYTVERTARVLRELASLNICVSKEQKVEGKESALPGEIGVAVSQMGNVLIDMAKEEVEELMATVARDGAPKEGVSASPYYDSYMALAAPILGLAKADLEAKLEETLQKRDVEQPEEDVLQKLDDANKRADEAVAKAARLESEMSEIAPLVKGLQAQVEQILKMPQPKAPTTVVVGKGDQPDAPGQQPLDLNKFSPDQLADAAFRMAHQHPRHVVIPVAGQN